MIYINGWKTRGGNEMRIKDKQLIKDEGGITLVALIITIIILIILAAVTIYSFTDSNLIKTATNGTVNYANAQASELSKFDGLSNTLDKAILEIESNNNSNKDNNQDDNQETVNALIKRIKESPSEYYGKALKGYTGYACEASNYEWQIYYSDGKNLYITTKDYIETKDCPEKDGVGVTAKGKHATYNMDFSSIYQKYNGYSDLINNPVAIKWLSYLESDYAKDNGNMNMCSTAYLLDYDVWNTKFKGNNAEYAIGGPTMDLFKASYNDMYPDKKIEIQPDTFGYKIGWQSNNVFRSDVLANVVSVSQSGNVYVLPEGRAAYQWFASPSANNESWLCYMVYNGSIYLYGNHTSDFGIRPIVCLSSNVNLQEIEEGGSIYLNIVE